MSDVDQSVRIRAFIQSWLLVIIIALLILAALTGWWAYQVNVVPEYEQEERIIESWSESSEFDHRAEIINDSLVWDIGDVVENRPLYYFRLSDELEGEYSYQFTADEGELTVDTELTLLIQAVDGDNIFWEYAQPLGSVEGETLGPEETHNTTVTVDIQNVLETIATIEEQVGAQEGLVDVRVQAITDVEGTVEGSDHEATHESDMVMVVNPQTFRVIETETISVAHEDSTFIDVPIHPTTFEQFGSIAAFLLAILALISLGVAQMSGKLDITEEEQEMLRLESEREEFDDWITTGKFPAQRDYESTILVDDLVGLVDVAIDTNNRVIEDPEMGVSAVLAEEYIYIYVHPDSPARDWLINYADVTMEEFQGM